MHVPAWIGYVPLLMVLFAMWRRSRNIHKPLRGNGTTLLIPAFGIMTGIPFVMLHPDGHIGIDAPLWQPMVAVLVGLVFAVPLVYHTNYERRADGQIYQRSAQMLLLTFGVLVGLRVVMRLLLSDMDVLTETALFFLMVVTYIVTWRIASFLKYRRVLNETGGSSALA
ncbi:cytochrome c biogenesis protein CcdC [Deinococcus yavapaiensis]|uniref:Uncharacterized protein DUF1453 n=1 Tax=Deinococcus yavapaiensis KR-236 TaxID=694435 RepID=A0A318S3V5_9DEIO|nr:cytochrome c biogenesis protein CcdC [Deinococcus yavapaiensis]PYE51127.1 uncharacterized protein DUF1453 [Deinococcus yavapaiensis KR-236]